MQRSICVLVITVLAFYSVYLTIVYVQQIEGGNSIAFEYNGLVGRYNNLVGEHNSLSRRYDSLQSNYSYTKSALNQSYQAYNMLLKNYSGTQIIYRSPATNQSISIWGMQQKVRPNDLIQWNLLDTFINHVEIRTNQTAQLLILDLNNYFNYRAGHSYVAIYNMTGTYFRTEMHVTQGCATYVLLVVNKLNSTMTIHPNITATYAPTPFLTGQCTLSP